jgi:hypothetical protein
MSNSKYTDTDYLALGHYLRREMFGVELNEEENCMATMSILKFPEIEIPEGVNKIQRIEVDGKWGFISKNGWIALPIYGSCGWFSEGLAGVKKEGKWGFIDENGNEVIECKYSIVGYFVEGINKVMKSDGGCSFIDKTGKDVIVEGEHYSFIAYERFRKGFMKVNYRHNKYSEKWIEGYVDKQGKIHSNYSVWIKQTWRKLWK